MRLSLTTRVSMFFLGVLALVLIGFAATFYFLAHVYLHRQADDRVDAALNTLVAAAEVTEEGVEWEPTDHSISLGQHSANEQILWLVRDEGGPIVEQSRSMSPEQQALMSSLLTDEQQTNRFVDQQGAPWRIRQRRLAMTGDHPSTEKPTDSDVQTGEHSTRHAALMMTVGTPLAPVEAALRNLLLLLVSVSLGLWLLAALIGRWLCRRALVPVTRMAVVARGLQAEALDRRLPSPETQDELEDLCRAFNDLLARLHESFERQARFTGDASHQLRSPLTAMLGQLDVALLRQRSPDEYRQALSQAKTQAHRLAEIVETLLFLSRADGEAQLSNLEPIELSAWLTQYMQTWSAHPRADDIRLDFDRGQPVWVKAQRSLLTQLLDNLLDNAAKYSPSATPITVRLWCDREAAMIVVDDAGYGIGAADLPHVFEPFFRSEPARRLGKNGIGLGLSVAQRIARVFGGQIVAESLAGQVGSRFSLRLPLLLHRSADETATIPIENPLVSVLSR